MSAMALRAQTETVLDSFVGPPTDGAEPFSGLISDASGNLYETTMVGGSSPFGFSSGCGTVFELVKTSAGYTEKVLYSFANGGDGGFPVGGLIMDSAGNLYGTAGVVVFELVKSPTGYTEDVLYTISDANDGTSAGLAMDSAGNLYGTTVNGGTFSQGTVFELVKTPDGYSPQVLHNFTGGSDGGYLQTGLILDSAGNLYGTTWGGGTCGPVSGGFGTVFELEKSSDGYTETVLYNFCNAATVAGVTMDQAGNLYGTTLDGGSGRVGGIFELVKSSTGYAFHLLLYSFQDTPGDGSTPQAGLIMDSAGNLYGTTEVGDALESGTVFELNPNATLSGVTLSPSSLTFGSGLLGITIPPQLVRLGNYTNTTLNLNNISLSGTDAGDFSLALSGVGTNCLANTSVASGGGTCGILVLFTPSMGGNESAILNVADSAGTQTVSLAGTGVVPDFIFSTAPGSPSSATVAPGGSTSFSLTLALEGGFNQPVSLTCAGAPSLATCSVSPGLFTLNGTNAATVTVSVTTTAPTLTIPRVTIFPITPLAAIWFTPLGLTVLSVLWFALNRGKPGMRWLAPLTLVLLAVVLSASCGGGGGSAAPSSPSSPGTREGTYTLTVTGTSGSLTHSMAVTLTVN
jgi:uncharacterized repeat protein (TIGR03803 family)